MISDGEGACARSLSVPGSNPSSGRLARSRNSRLYSVDGYPSNRFKKYGPLHVRVAQAHQSVRASSASGIPQAVLLDSELFAALGYTYICIGQAQRCESLLPNDVGTTELVLAELPFGDAWQFFRAEGAAGRD